MGDIYDEKKLTKKQLQGELWIEDICDPMESGADKEIVDFCTMSCDYLTVWAGIFKSKADFKAWFYRCDDNMFSVNLWYNPKTREIVLHFTMQSDLPIDDRFITVKGSAVDELIRRCEEACQNEAQCTCGEYLDRYA